MLYSTFLFSVVFTFASCVPDKSNIASPQTEVINYILHMYDTSGNQMIKPVTTFSEKVWFQDSMAIEEVSTLSIITDTANITTQSVDILYYRFSDLRTENVYEYKNFSDTAKLIIKYCYKDSSNIIGGWNFKFPRKIKYSGNPESLKDTVMENIIYKRLRLATGTKDYPSLMDCYFRCDKTGTIFNSDTSLSKITGCPLVKTHNYFPLKNGTPSSGEVKFLRNTFTSEEQKVFDAWKKYAKENPVNK